MTTLKLTQQTWDLTLNSSGNIALDDDGLAVAQDVASAISLFSGELFYDTTQGVPYFNQILGASYNKSLVEALLEKAALTVPQVVKAKATINSFTNRRISGIIKVTDVNSVDVIVNF